MRPDTDRRRPRARRFVWMLAASAALWSTEPATGQEPPAAARQGPGWSHRWPHLAVVGPLQARPLPENAVPRLGIDTVGYPHVGPRQVTRLALEVAGASAREIVRHPGTSLTHTLGRGAERVGVRLHEIGTFLRAEAPCPRASTAADGDLDAAVGSPPMPAHLTWLPSSEAAVLALLAQIATATQRIDLMMYGWEDDPTGREVAAALATAARRGVAVRLLVDRGADLLHNPASAAGRPTFLDQLANVPGIRLIRAPDPFLEFDHRKLACIDGQVAWSGGMILTEVARRRWENLAFLAQGPVVEQYGATFEDRWRYVGGEPGAPARAATALPLPNARVRLVRTDHGQRSLKAAIDHAVDHARHHVYVENPYFSDALLAEKLIEARRRGVDVRVVITLRGNVERLNRYVVLIANRLWRGGVAVHLAPGMTHVKALSADGHWAYVGTGNFDELSLRNNREVGLAVSGSAIVRELEERLLEPSQARAERLEAPLPLPANLFWLELMKLWF